MPGQLGFPALPLDDTWWGSGTWKLEVYCVPSVWLTAVMNAFHNLDAVAALIVLFSIRYQRVFVFKAYQGVLLHICGRKNGNKNWKTILVELVFVDDLQWRGHYCNVYQYKHSIQLLISVQIILFLINFPSCEHLWKAFNTLKYTPLQLIFNSILTIGNKTNICSLFSEIRCFRCMQQDVRDIPDCGNGSHLLCCQRC